jgi:hypothetical protein
VAILMGMMTELTELTVLTEARGYWGPFAPRGKGRAFRLNGLVFCGRR